MAGYQDLIDWCNGTALPGNRKTAVSVNLYQVPAPNQPAEAAWAGTLSKSPPAAPHTFVLDGELQPVDGTHWPVQLHIVIDTQNMNANATISGHHIKPEWQGANSQVFYNTPDYHGDAVISGKVEIYPSPTPNWTELFPLILGPTYTYHPPSP